MNEAILHILKHRKINDKSKEIKNKKNTPKDYNIKNNLKKNKNDNTNENDNIFLNEASMEYYNKHILPINTIKNYNSTVRSFKEDLYKWKLLHKRLLLSSKINNNDIELSSMLKNEAYWLKNNNKTTVILNKSNIYDKTAPSVKNSKENYNIYTLPTKYDVKNKLIKPKNTVNEIKND